MRAVMVLLSLHGLPPAQIAMLLERVPVTVRHWIGRFHTCGVAGLADHPRCGRPRMGGNRLRARSTALLKQPEPWTVPRLYRYLGWSHLSRCTLYRRVRQVAVWRRPKLMARGDSARPAVVAAISGRVRLLPTGAVVWADDETHLHLLPHVRSSSTPPGRRPQIPTPGKNRQITVLGAPETTTGTFRHRLGRHRAADFLTLLRQLVAAFPNAPAVVVICDNDPPGTGRALETVRRARATTMGPAVTGSGGRAPATGRRGRRAAGG
ncbi:helix-turn-helix domain-containing protein [Streptomyces sp. DG2A-72]|nr:helix-turn-helix domain-containing protein [Streptomyces sp. DG2A-72]MDO0930512.1 helix-turn-helix domain-containing protein [Streptomyces sp. DG2A-72]